MIDSPPCRGCEHESLPKSGAFLGEDGKYPTSGNYKHRTKRKLEPNPCFTCTLPGEYADYIESIFLMPPCREEPTQYVGGNIADKAVRDILE